MNCIICVVKIKVLISCAVTAQLISIIAYACVKSRFVHDVGNKPCHVPRYLQEKI